MHGTLHHASYSTTELCRVKPNDGIAAAKEAIQVSLSTAQSYVQTTQDGGGGGGIIGAMLGDFRQVRLF